MSHHIVSTPSSAPGSVALQLFLLGPPYVVQDGQPLSVARLQIRLLLYRLGMLEPVPREELAFLFWPDMPDASARRNLTQLLSHLRRALPDKDLLLATQNHIQLDPQQVWSDVAAFQDAVAGGQEEPVRALREAVTLYRGPLLEGVSAPEHAEWESWLFNERQALEHRYLDALTTLVHDAASRGAYTEGIDLVRHYLAVDELDEEMHRHLIELYTANGDRSAALQQYEQCVAILERELGVDPMPETRAAYEAALTERPTNLPVPPTPLIGREKEVAQVVTLVRQEGTWLVTLTGPGGTGKTRLGLEVAHRLLPAFAHGVFFVSLAPLRDHTLVLSTIAQVLGVQEVGGESLLECVKRFLREKQLLLVMDNFEHVLEAVPLLAELRGIAPRLTILATSREWLHLRGEKLFPVSPLALPGEETTSPDEVAEVEAIRLFVERARDVRLDFTLGKHNSMLVVEICARLDGLPLAIELVAAHCYRLSAQAILDSLSPVLDVAVDGPRDLPARQQTLRATIAWSYDLLDEPEQCLFRRLAVFAGGCTVESAEAVYNSQGERALNMSRGLTSLTDKSLLRRVPNVDESEGPRYEMLETIREYATERLVASGEADMLREQHLGFFLGIAEEAEARNSTSEHALWLNRLEVDHDNLRAALHWSLPNEERSEQGVRLAGALAWFWLARGYWSEGSAWLLKAVEAQPDITPSIRIKVLRGRASFRLFQGDTETAQESVTEMLNLSRTTGDQVGIAFALGVQGEIAVHRKDLSTARPLLEESISIRRELQDARQLAMALCYMANLCDAEANCAQAEAYRAEALGIFQELGNERSVGIVLNDLGWAVQGQGDYARAAPLYAQSAALMRKLGDRYHYARATVNLATVAIALNELIRAETLLRETLPIFVELGAYRDIAWCISGLGGVAVKQGRLDRATRLLGAVEARIAAINDHMWHVDQREYNHYVEITRRQLDEGSFAVAWAEGGAMPLEQAIAYALETVAPIHGRFITEERNS